MGQTATSQQRPVGRPRSEQPKERLNLALRPSRKAWLIKREATVGLSPTKQIEAALDLLEKSEAGSQAESISAQVRQVIEETLRPITSRPVFYPAGQIPEGIQGTPVLGSISAGSPTEGDGAGQEEIHCSKHPRGPGYVYVKVSGDSMDRIIPDGAFALIRQNRPYKNGDIVALQIGTGDVYETTLKRYRTDGVEIWYEPDSTNPDHVPIILSTVKPKKKHVLCVDPENAWILGVFSGHFLI